MYSEFLKIRTKYLGICCSLLVLGCCNIYAQSNKFKVVLDAGHGGKDPGAVYFGINEKDIALSVTLKIGAILAKSNEIDLIYTRDKDVTVSLYDRPKIANKSNANLFVSIHCNSVANSSPFGTETFVMGFSKNVSNLEVAKKENSVIYLEEDYQTKYAGFDPNSPETMIGLKITQEENRDQSINFASKIQEGFTNNLNRFNRGVKEGGLWVLHQTYMPSVLIELGFISNKKESLYLNSEKGQNELAKVIAEAIIRYKKEFYGEGTLSFTNENVAVVEVAKPITEPIQNQTPTVQNQTPTETSIENVVYKVQIAASGTKVALAAKNFNGLNPISVIQESNVYKYMYGEFLSLKEAKDAQKVTKEKGYDSSFIVAFRGERKIRLDSIKQ